MKKIVTLLLAVCVLSLTITSCNDMVIYVPENIGGSEVSVLLGRSTSTVNAITNSMDNTTKPFAATSGTSAIPSLITTKPAVTTVPVATTEFTYHYEYVYNFRPGFENVDFAGYTFTFASPLDNADGWGDYEVYAEEDGEGILDAAINQRNNLLLEHYDCFIEVQDIANGTLTNDFATGQNNIDIVLDKYNMNAKATKNYYNFYDLGLDLEQPWWDQGFIKDATVNGQIYTMLGAFSLTSFDATWVMFFNKNVKETNDNLRGIDFYELVYNNEWTLDKFFELVKAAYHDDGDQVPTLGTADVFGLVSSSYGIRGLYFGADQGYLTKTTATDGYTTFSHAFTQAAVEATNIIIEIYAHEATQLADYVKVEAQMRSNGVLFVPEVLRMASYYAGKQGESAEPVNIGILPHPKLNANQDGYKHNVDSHVIYMCIPTTCADLDRMADFLELYAYHSYFTVYKSYLNLYKYTYTTDSNSAEMVDYILQSRSFDLAYQYNFTSIDSEYLNSVQNGTNQVDEFATNYGDAIVEAANSYRDKLPGNNY